MKRLEDADQLLRRDAHARVLDEEADPVFVATHLEGDAALACVLDRVVEEVHQHLAKPAFIRADHRRKLGEGLREERELLVLRAGPHHLDDARKKLSQIERRGLEIEAPRFDLGEIEDFVDESEEMLARLLDDRQRLFLLRQKSAVALQELHVP